MAKQGCSCGGGTHTIGELDTNAILSEGGVIVAGYTGFYAGEMLTENVSVLKENKAISGGVKLGGALGLPLVFPSWFGSRYVRAFTLGVGISGGKDIAEYAGLTPATNGIYDEWENYDRNTVDTGSAIRIDA